MCLLYVLMVDLLMFPLQPQYHHRFLSHLFCLLLFLFHLVCRLLFLSHHLLSINMSVGECLLFKAKWAIFQIYHNKLILNEWLINWCLASSEQFFSNIMMRTNYISIRWWWFLLCTSWIFYSASSLNQQSAGRHITPLTHIILKPSEPIIDLTP